MKKGNMKILAIVLAVGLSVITACSSNNHESDIAGNHNSWEDLDGWEDDNASFDWEEDDGNENEFPYPYPDTATVYFNGSERTWCGAEGCYYENANYEYYRNETHILADFQDGAVVSFIINSSSNFNARLWVRLSVDTNWKDHAIWASDKFDLTVNGNDVNLNAEEGVDEKWLWQQTDWWEPGNFIDANFGTINLVSGNNTVVLRTKNNDGFEDHCHILLDCFMIDPA